MENVKRILSLGLIFVLGLSLFATTFASSDQDWIAQEIEKTNASIEQMIADAKRDADREISKMNMEIELYRMLGRISNAPVDKLIENAEQRLERSLDRIIDKLVRDTDGLANQMIQKAAEYGIEVICEYVAVEIGGRTVWIDPLRIVDA